MIKSNCPPWAETRVKGQTRRGFICPRAHSGTGEIGF